MQCKLPQGPVTTLGPFSVDTTKIFDLELLISCLLQELDVFTTRKATGGSVHGKHTKSPLDGELCPMIDVIDALLAQN